MPKLLPSLLVAAALLLLAACSTTESRIRDQQALFDSWPADVQQKIRAGRIDLGFTPEMVKMALGGADRIDSRVTDQGESDYWIYLDHGPRFEVGIAGGTAHGSTAIGGSMAVGDNFVFRDNESMRVIFEGGKVTAVEVRRK